MDENTLKLVARQLRKPEGEMGKKVGERMNTGNELMNLNAIEKLHPQPGDSILEIGMGNGFYVKNILAVHQSINYSGCDISELMVEESRKLNQSYMDKGRARFELTSGNLIPYPDQYFNKVFTVNTIYFWENEAAQLSEIRRVLKPGGKLIIGLRPKSVMLLMPMTQYGFKLFSKEDVADLLADNAFKVTDILEKEEPDEDQNGVLVKKATLVVCADKI